jgi:hypothetical protein
MKVFRFHKSFSVATTKQVNSCSLGVVRLFSRLNRSDLTNPYSKEVVSHPGSGYRWLSGHSQEFICAIYLFTSSH